MIGNGLMGERVHIEVGSMSSIMHLTRLRKSLQGCMSTGSFVLLLHGES